MKYNKFIALILLLFCTSCAHGIDLNKDTLPRTSFVHLNKNIKLYACEEGTPCDPINLRSSASGYIVRITSEGSYIVTAAHFCEQGIPNKKNQKLILSYVSRKLNGDPYESKVLSYKRDIDVCMMFAKGMTRDVSAVRISNSKPKVGEKIYNLAAPFSIFSPNMVPILEGRYNGHTDKDDFYTLPAAPGSSGSMIVNKNGELVGMVHSVFIRFNVITLSTRHKDLIKFIDNNLRAHTTDGTNMKSTSLIKYINSLNIKVPSYL